MHLCFLKSVQEVSVHMELGSMMVSFVINMLRRAAFHSQRMCEYISCERLYLSIVLVSHLRPVLGGLLLPPLMEGAWLQGESGRYRRPRVVARAKPNCHRRSFTAPVPTVTPSTTPTSQCEVASGAGLPSRSSHRPPALCQQSVFQHPRANPSFRYLPS
jgi:hypothetical protein